MTMDQQILHEAAAWHASMSGDSPDFEGFMFWLEASDMHRRAYDQLTLLDETIKQHRDGLQSLVPANDTGKTYARRWLWIPTIAALLLLAFLSAPFLHSGAPVTEETAVGETRQIALSDSTKITLDADSAIATNNGTKRTATLLRGRAHFEIAHNAEMPFTVDIGPYQVRDLGTRFEVSRDGDNFVVTVAEGMVSVDGKGIQIQAGKGERVSVQDGKAQKSQVDSESIAVWRDGRLVYQDTSLTQVVADINRYSKKRLALDPALAGQRFSGVLIIGDGSQLARNVADLIGLSLEVTKTGERLVRH